MNHSTDNNWPEKIFFKKLSRICKMFLIWKCMEFYGLCFMAVMLHKHFIKKMPKQDGKPKREIHKPPRFRSPSVDSEKHLKKLKSSSTFLRKMEKEMENSNKSDGDNTDVESLARDTEENNSSSEDEQKEDNEKEKTNVEEEIVDKRKIMNKSQEDDNIENKKMLKQIPSVNLPRIRNVAVISNNQDTQITQQVLTGLKEYFDEKFKSLETKLISAINNATESANEVSLTRPPGFPLQSTDEVKAFEDDIDKQNDLKRYLILWGGSDLKSTIRQYIKDGLSDDCVKNITWARKEEKDSKMPLYNTKFSQILYSAAKTVFKHCTIEDFSAAMQNAIRAAKQRSRDKINRDKKKETGHRTNYLEEMAELYNR